MTPNKRNQPGACPPPLRYEWTKAYPARPKDNLIVHPDIHRQRPFRPSYDMEGEPKMDCLLDWSYARQWQIEATAFRETTQKLVPEKKPKKKIPVYPSARPNPASTSKQRFTMKKFQNVPSKVDTRGTLHPSKKHLIPNLESKCRLCLSDKAIVQCIFQSENSKEVTDTLVEKIFECTAIMLSKDFDFPSPICEDCAFKLDEFLLFRTKCLRSNEIYRFNRLHKQRFLFGNHRAQANERKPPVDDSSGGSEQGDHPEPTTIAAQEPPSDGTASLEYERVSLPLLPIAEVSGSSSSDNHTVIDTDVCQQGNNDEAQPVGGEMCMDRQPGQPSDGVDASECNGNHGDDRPEQLVDDDELIVRWKPPDPDDSEDGTSRLSPAPVVLLVDETDTTVSEGEDVDELVLPLSEPAHPATVSDSLLACVGDIQFPVETVEQLEQLEHLVRTSSESRERYIAILRQLKTHNTSLSETYQRLFADRLLIHYNYDGISPKYNKRPLKTLLLFTDCMAGTYVVCGKRAR
ncbi:hypothetical protein ZHAS_00015767 [Anopheles sinensis]|uniref:ZAD domain-containing protein n=1 Tax=Anopheles sinensis TaxID=74873 RepID=A0A084WC67_ANOSI|nr:hypothetical protein ZHAS_00015767 [Anopheles sinensis]